MSDKTAIRFTQRDWLWLFAIWALATTTLMLRGVLAPADAPFFQDTDDAMRMVVARDFLLGQGWYDSIQHRLNTPFGADMHWSRLVDLPIAGLLWLAERVVAPSLALEVAGTVWPLLLLGLLLFLSLRTTHELVGQEGILPALVLPILSPAVLAEFTPGRVDHHNVIIVLTMATLLAILVAQRRPWAAWLAGLLVATGLAIATEALPVALAAILAFGFAYVADPGSAKNLRRFGLAFAGGMVVHLMLARPPARWLEAACDMISPVYALAGLAVGAAFLVVSLIPAPARPWQRLLLLACLGAAAAALVALVYSHCLAGPYGDLDPWLRDNWMNGVVEAKPWHVSLTEIPAYVVVVTAPVVLGAIAAIAAFRRSGPQRLQWLILIVFIAATALIMLAQIRGARLALLPTIPAAAWLIAEMRKAYLAKADLWRAVGLIGAWLAFSGIVLTIIVAVVLNLLPGGRSEAVANARAGKLECLAPEAFAGIAAMPPARVMTPIDLGAHVLLQTPHSVVAAPYHRNEDGMLDAFRFLNRPAEEAREIAARRGLELFVTCAAMPEMRGSGLKVAGTVSNLLAAGTPPGWLQPLSLDGPLAVYAIIP